MSSVMGFSIFCGRCYHPVSSTGHSDGTNASGGGSVLSCGDFLCANCAPSVLEHGKCPACGKGGVRAAFLHEALPEEVRQNVTDPSVELERLHTILSFQVKYYKHLIKRAVNTIETLDHENQKQRSYIQELEQKLKQTNVDSRQPFFTSANQEKFLDNQDCREQTTSVSPRESHRLSGLRATPTPSQPLVSSMYSSSSNSLVNRSPSFNPRENDRNFTNQNIIQSERSYVPKELPAFQLTTNNSSGNSVASECRDQPARKRIYTPSRTIFSSAGVAPENRMTPSGSPTPSRIRSPYVPIVNSGPHYSPRKMDSTFKSRLQPNFMRETQSPITAFMRQSFK